MKSINTNIFVSNIIVFLALLVLWLAVDYIDVKVVRIPDLQHDFMIALGAAWVSFLWTNWKFSKLGQNLKIFVIPTISLMLTAIWFFISAIVVGEFHLLIGGSI